MKMNAVDLFILILLLIIVTEPVKVKLNQTVVLPCRGTCTGRVRWSMLQPPGAVVAHCNETSCWPIEGYWISHSEYSMGNLSLTVRLADYTKRNTYTCYCEGKKLCDQHLSILPVSSSLLVSPGEELLMELPVTDHVELLYGGSHSGGTLGQICTVLNGDLQCSEGYEDRWSFSQQNLTLRETQTSDSGLYLILDTKNNNDIIHIYTVSVHDEQVCVSKQQDCDQRIRVVVLLVVMVMVMLIVLNAVVCRCKGVRLQGRRRSSKPDEEPYKEPDEEPDVEPDEELEDHGAGGSEALNILVRNENETDPQKRRRSRFSRRSMSDSAVSLKLFETHQLKHRRTQNSRLEHIPLMSDLNWGGMPFVPEEQ